MKVKLKVFFLAVLSMIVILSSGFTIPVPTASGTETRKNDRAEIDFSNASDGYVMIRFTGRTTQTVMVVIRGPRGTQFQFRLNTDGRWEVFPFSDGNGRYQIGVHEQIQGNRFSTVITAEVTVNLSSEFAPFIRPNQFVNFNQNSRVVARANELVRGSTGVLDSVARIYDFVITNISYDTALAATVQPGYVPDVDAVLARGKGICFDYAALMAAMLRSQGIPTQLITGYAGTVYHAWINVWSSETGWIHNVIQFDGRTWRLMDPTFAATGNQSPDVMRFIGDGTNHRPRAAF